MMADGRWFFDFDPSRAKDFLSWLTEGDAMILRRSPDRDDVALRTIEQAVGALAKKHGSWALAQVWIEDHLRHLARFNAVWCTSVDLASSTPAGSDEWDTQADSAAPENFALTANPLLDHIHLLPHEVVLKDSRLTVWDVHPLVDQPHWQLTARGLMITDACLSWLLGKPGAKQPSGRPPFPERAEVVAKLVERLDAGEFRGADGEIVQNQVARAAAEMRGHPNPRANGGYDTTSRAWAQLAIEEHRRRATPK